MCTCTLRASTSTPNLFVVVVVVVVVVRFLFTYEISTDGLSLIPGILSSCSQLVWLLSMLYYTPYIGTIFPLLARHCA